MAHPTALVPLRHLPSPRVLPVSHAGVISKHAEPAPHIATARKPLDFSANTRRSARQPAVVVCAHGLRRNSPKTSTKPSSRCPTVRADASPSPSSSSSDASAAAAHDGASAVPAAVIGDLIAFLETELPKLFVDGGMSSARFADKVEFEDPITRYDSLSGYLFNIQMLRFLFDPVFILRDTYQSGPCEITTRWTMKMYFGLLPWRPEVLFTGLSIYGIDPVKQQFVSHKDVWDSISDNGYFSQEGLRDLVKQMMTLYATPSALSSPQFDVLLRRANYEVRHYPSFQLLQPSDPVQSEGDIWQAGGATAVQMDKLNRLLMGPMVFIRDGRGGGKAAIAVPAGVTSLPDPTNADVSIRTVPAGTWAAASFGGDPSAAAFAAAAAALERDVKEDGMELLGGKEGSAAAAAAPPPSAAAAAAAVGMAFVSYPSNVPLPVLKRNEVLIQLEGFSLDQVGRTINETKR